MEKFQSEGADDQKDHSPTPERMVEATKISMVFSDAKLLERCADQLLSQGLISGFSIEPIAAGYLYRGKKVNEGQFALNILLSEQASEKTKELIRETLVASIGEQWDIPALEEETVRVNEQLLGFIKRAEVEHGKFVREKKLRLSISLTALLSIGGLIAMFTEKYAATREAAAVTATHKKEYERLTELHQKIQEQISHLEGTLSKGGELTVHPTDMAAQDSYIETQEILETVRGVQDSVRRLTESK